MNRLHTLMLVLLAVLAVLLVARQSAGDMIPLPVLQGCFLLFALCFAVSTLIDARNGQVFLSRNRIFRAHTPRLFWAAVSVLLLLSATTIFFLARTILTHA